jgi:hypothetical protein
MCSFDAVSGLQAAAKQRQLKDSGLFGIAAADYILSSRLWQGKSSVKIY